jgi:WD40 repeat protein
MRARLTASVLTLLSLAGPAFAQEDRRSLTTPELVVDSGGRLGSCDAIKFTSDGKYLLAVGDDKVVRVWPYVEPLPQSWFVPRWYQDSHLTTQGMDVLRWPSWREQRGAIFALALSPDKDNERIAIGGLGIRNGTVAVLDRKTKKILHLATPVPPEGEQVNSIWSMDFAPDGKRVAFGDSHAGVWVWDFKTEPRLLGRHGEFKLRFNFVRSVHFFDNNTLVSAAEDGTLWRWDLDRNPPGRDLKPFPIPKGATVFRVTVSPDDKWFAAAAQGARDENQVVVVRSVDGKTSKPIRLKDREFARAVAFDTKSERLFVSVASRQNVSFYMEGPERVAVYDLKNVHDSGKDWEPIDELRGLYRAWYIAFHPNGKEVAIAAGENHEVTLYNLAALGKPLSVMEGVGKSIWDVALSQDGKQVGFRDLRNRAATNPNDRAAPGAPWRVFHLGKRDWADPTAFRAIKQNREWEGWRVAGLEDDRKPKEMDPFHWWVVEPGGSRWQLETDRQDQMPFCWTFIPPEGKRKLQLAVGHLWGVSIFELTKGQKPKRVRLCTGHQAYVTSVAVSADGSWLVSGSMDQTLTAWSLKDWPSQRTLGASFDLKGKNLVVTQVDVGSPAWEAGLFAGDIVTAFHFEGKKDRMPGGPDAWWKQLRDPKPGVEHRFDVLRDGKPVPKLATTARQRPLWRFFPTRDNEWVLWMWQNSYYDTSTNGDSYIGWLVNAPDLDREPQFVPAERFREVYNRPGILNILVAENSIAEALHFAQGNNPLPTRFDQNEPPIVALNLAAAETKTENVKATLTVVPQGGSVDFQPVRAELWINDFRMPLQDSKFTRWRQNGRALEYDVTIPNAKLRAGANSLTFQVYNRVEGRAEAAKPLTCTRDGKESPRRLYGLIVGVNKYGKSQVQLGPAKRGPLENLGSACRDAEALRESLRGQKKGLYQEIDLTLCLDEQASRAGILAALDRLAEVVGPEDNCVIFLAGHGTFDAPKPKQDSTKWRFCCPDFDDTKPGKTSVSDDELQEKLAAIAGRKVVLLDACHSGQAAVANPVRPLVPSGQGPIVIAACDRQQRALENDEHGLFTAALLEALGPNFRDADTDGNQTLDARELFDFTRRELPNLLEKIQEPRFKQRPICFAPKDVKMYPLAAEKK